MPEGRSLGGICADHHFSRRSGVAGQQLLGQCQAGSAKAIREEPEVTNAHEPSGKNVQKETTQELRGEKSHLALLATVSIILPAKGDELLVEGQQAMIGNRHAMGVAAEIAYHLQGTTEGGFGIDDPVVAMPGA